MYEQPQNKDTNQVMQVPTLDGAAYRSHFHKQAKLAAEFTRQILTQEDPENSVVLDLGVGGVVRNASGQVTSHYRPFYAAELSSIGLKPEQIVGLDMAEPDPDLAEAYTHINADLLVILSSPEAFVSFLESKLKPEKLRQLTLITSNNLFNNVAPGLVLEADRMLENLLAAAAILAARYNLNLKVINFDGPCELGSGDSVFALQNGSMDVDEEFNYAYNLQYEQTFGE